MITVKDGLIVEIQPFYWDTAAVLRHCKHQGPCHAAAA
jgi:hypothetical protein